MFFLAGLLGMMALGSVVIASTGGMDEEEDEFDGMVSSTAPSLSGQTDGADGADVATDMLADIAAENPGLGPDDPAARDPAALYPAAGGAGGSDDAADDAVDSGTDDSGTDDSGAEDSGADDFTDESEPQSLFARMGLINMPGLGAEGWALSGSSGAPAGDPVGMATGEVLTGTDATDLLNGGALDDLIEGGGNADVLCGGEGQDTLAGGDGHDTLHGDGGADLLRGGADGDTLYGHHGDDTLAGEGGDDSLIGGLGDDLLDGGAGADALHGREGADSLTGGLGTDTLFGGWDNDVLDGVMRGADGSDLDGTDYLNGGDGDDTIVAGSGDVVTGGAGADVMVLGNWITGDAAELADYDAAEDQLVIVYDDSNGAGEPELEMRLSADDPGVTEIVMNGQVLSTMPTEDAPPIDMLVLVGESVAAQMAFG